MTVIAFSAKHRAIASDSRCSDKHDAHFTQTKKVYRLKNGAIYGSAGASDDRDLRAMLARSTPRRLPSRADLLPLKQTISGIIVFPKGQCYTVEMTWDDEVKDWDASVDLVTDAFVAIGSGYQFALGALEAGASPQQAVRAACRRDLACALPVQTERLL